MFGLGMTELLLIGVIALVIVGPKKLPEVAKSIGKGYGEFRRSFNDIKQTVNFDEDLKNIGNSSAPRPTATKEEYSENYRSQWEQKLTQESIPQQPAQEVKQVVVENDSNTDDNGEKRG